MDSRFLHSSAALCLLALGAACSPVQSHSGFRPDFNNVQIADPEVGVDTKDTVTARFGTPSTSAVFDQTTWYYLSSVQERFAFYTPRTTDRRVLVVRFDASNVVSAVEHFGLERGRIVAYNGDKTPTRGRELGVLEQIFGNIGNTPPIRAGEEEEGGRRRR
jgi:outer membrane protein assembly factor BamE (lipoprotein component of BamABCDE complex)